MKSFILFFAIIAISISALEARKSVVKGTVYKGAKVEEGAYIGTEVIVFQNAVVPKNTRINRGYVIDLPTTATLIDLLKTAFGSKKAHKETFSSMIQQENKVFSTNFGKSAQLFVGNVVTVCHDHPFEEHDLSRMVASTLAYLVKFAGGAEKYNNLYKAYDLYHKGNKKYKSEENEFKGFKEMLNERHFGLSSVKKGILSEDTIKKLHPVMAYFYETAHVESENAPRKSAESDLCKMVKRLKTKNFTIYTPDSFSKHHKSNKSHNKDGKQKDKHNGRKIVDRRESEKDFLGGFDNYFDE